MRILREVTCQCFILTRIWDLVTLESYVRNTSSKYNSIPAKKRDNQDLPPVTEDTKWVANWMKFLDGRTLVEQRHDKFFFPQKFRRLWTCDGPGIRYVVAILSGIGMGCEKNGILKSRNIQFIWMSYFQENLSWKFMLQGTVLLQTTDDIDNRSAVDCTVRANHRRCTSALPRCEFFR